MIDFCTRYLEKVRGKNSTLVSELSQKLAKTYDPGERRKYEEELREEWEKTGEMPDKIKLWNLFDIYDYNNSIYYDVAAIYLEDCQKNLPEYFKDPKNILVDSWYATNIEDSYLHYVAHKHQEKNEKNSKKLLQRITDVREQMQHNTEADSNALVKSHPLTTSLLNERRQKEEDAKCSICGSGDYEENDLIVFCGFCGIAVHQS